MKLVILDIDETLIHTSSKQEEGSFQFDDENFIKKRPHVERFLELLEKDYYIGVWSAGEKNYVKFIVEKVLCINPIFILSRDHCDKLINDEGEVEYVKPLSKIWFEYPEFNDRNTIVVDDKDSTATYNLTNYIHIAPFEGDKNDKELIKLDNFLCQNYYEPNVKTYCSVYK